MKIGEEFECTMFDRNSYLVETTKTTFLYVELLLSHVIELCDTWGEIQAVHKTFENIV